MNESDMQMFLEKFNPEIRELALQTRALILAAFPGALEMVDPPSGIIAYGHSRKYADLIFAIAPFKDHVNLMFSKGASLADPAGLLSGTGKRARHARIHSAADLKQPELLTLLAAALARP